MGYFIQLTFLSVGFWLLDIPHQIAKGIAQITHNARQANKEVKKEFIDTYAFDLGYHMSYGLTTFAIALCFSTLVPYVPLFATLFFMFKYYVDKYNLSFVYNTEFRGFGFIKRRVIPFSIFNIVLYQLINVGFFSSKVENRQFLIIGLIVVAVELVTIIITHFYSK